jgi:Tol biopolymer transport system component
LFLTHGSQEYGRGYHVLDVETGTVKYVDALDGLGDGHPSLSPNGEWIATDTYPDQVRNRTLMLYNLKNDELIRVGRFFSPFGFDDSVRCDLHPQWSPDGRYLSIDSAHTGRRDTYVLDVSAIVD